MALVQGYAMARHQLTLVNDDLMLCHLHHEFCEKL